VKAEIDKINSTGVLPPGVHLERIYDRSDLIGVTTHTVMENLVAGVLLIFFLQWAFLGNLRSALIVAATIPFALAFAVLILTVQGESANLLSVGALDFGLVVDATVIMVENIFRHMAERAPCGNARRRALYLRQPHRRGAGGQQRSEPRHLLCRRDHHHQLPAAVHADRRGRPHLRPDGQDLCLCHLGGLIATFTVAPVLSAMMLPDKLDETETWLVSRIRRVYEPVAAFAFRNQVLAIGRAGRWCSGRSSACARWGSSSCRTWKKATCTSAPRCRRRSRSTRVSRWRARSAAIS
jgi:cobalt-zinc-cadmium resistance protein CzcA